MRTPGSNGAETLRNLRSAAVRLLSEHGYEAMNLRMLAKSIGVQVGSLYNYIDSKQQLLFWLLKEGVEGLLNQFDERMSGIGEPAAQMRDFVAFHLGYHIEHLQESLVLSTEKRSLTPKNYRAISHFERLYTEKVQGIIDRGIATGDFRVADSPIATFGLLQMLTSVIRWYQPRGRLTRDELIEVYLDLTFAMLQADRPNLELDDSEVASEETGAA
ncbi:MAG: TetR/AcrR family transcriptional regulator [Candidatus Binataceae bacterium]|jgi:AcrR family transcriptional regulator